MNNYYKRLLWNCNYWIRCNEYHGLTAPLLVHLTRLSQTLLLNGLEKSGSGDDDNASAAANGLSFIFRPPQISQNTNFIWNHSVADLYQSDANVLQTLCVTKCEAKNGENNVTNIFFYSSDWFCLFLFGYNSQVNNSLISYR